MDSELRMALCARSWLGVLLFASGCYHAANDELAQRTLAAFREAKTSSGIDAERELSKQLLEAELASTRGLVEANRDADVAKMLMSPWAPPSDESCIWSTARPCQCISFQCVFIDSRLVRLAGTTSGATESSALLAYGTLRGASIVPKQQANLDAAESMYHQQFAGRTGAVTLACALDSDTKVPVPAEGGTHAEYVTMYNDACADLRAAVHKRRAALAQSGGLIGASFRFIERRHQEVLTANEKGARLNEAYLAAVTAQGNAASAKGNLATALAALKTAQQKVSDAIAQAPEVADLQKNRLKLAELQLRYDEATKVLDRLITGEPAKESVGETVLGTMLVLEKIQGEQDLPRLMLEVQQLRGQLAALQTMVTHANRQLALEEERAGVMLEHLGALLDAKAAFRQAGSECAASKRPAEASGTVLQALQASRSKACKTAIATSLHLLAGAWTRSELRERVLARRLDGDLHDEAIDLSAVASAQWEDVLGVSLEAVAQLHASGIKTEDLARMLVDIAGIVGISLAIGLK